MAKNKRCPLQAECGRKCEFEKRELKCDYYRNNGIGDFTINDQEELRELEARLTEEERYMKELEEFELEEDKNSIVFIPIENLYSHPDNPRKELGDLTELADSIKAKGVLQNLTVVPRDEPNTYTVIIGHRRTAAAKLAGLTELPCIITEMTPAEQVQTMLLENMQRVDLTPYEQAVAFHQLKFDFGDSVNDIAKKTGFSSETVKKRLKMAELDHNKLKEVSVRQISLADFDKLSKIEAINIRNEVLADIGTANFNQRYQSALKKQNIAKNLPLIKSALRTLKAKKIKDSEAWGGKYTRIGDYIYIDKWDELTPLVPVNEKRELYYTLDETYGSLRFFVLTPKAKPVKRPQSEIDREKYIAQTRQKLDELSEICRKLRADFADNLRFDRKNAMLMLFGATDIMKVSLFKYMSARYTDLCKKAGFEYDYGHADESRKKLFDAIEENPQRMIPAVIYNAHCDDGTHKYYSGYAKEFPKYTENKVLDALYKWLTSLGYEMSDDEKALQNGTHELFTDKDKK